MILPEAQPHQKLIVAELNRLWNLGIAARKGSDLEGAESIESAMINDLRDYMGKHRKGAKFGENRSRRHLGWANTVTQLILSEWISMMLPFPAFFTLRGADAAGHEAKERVKTELLHQFKQMGLREQLRTVGLCCAIFGIAPFIISWHTKQRLVTEGLTPNHPGGWLGVATDLLDKVKGAKKAQAGVSPTRKWKTVFNGLRITPLNPFDVVRDPNPSSGADPRDAWCIVRDRSTMAELQRMSKEYPGGYQRYSNLDKLKFNENGTPDVTDNYEDEVNEALGLEPTGGLQKYSVVTKAFHGDLTITVSGKPLTIYNIIATWGNDDVILSLVDNDAPQGMRQVHFLTWQESGAPGATYAHGALAAARGLGNLGMAIFNQFVDWVSKIIKGQNKVKKTSPAYLEGIDYATESAIPVDRMDDIEPMRIDGSLFELVGLVGMLEVMHSKACGSPNAYSGEQEARTAYEISRINAATDKRFSEIGQHHASEFEPVIKYAIGLIARYAPETFQRPESDPATDEEKMIDISREDFGHDFEVHMVGAGLRAQKAEEFAGVNQFINALGAMSPELRMRLKEEKLWTRLHRLTVGEDDDELFEARNQVEEMLRDAQQGADFSQGPGADPEAAATITSLVGASGDPGISSN